MNSVSVIAPTALNMAYTSGEAWPFEKIRWSLLGSFGLFQSYCKYRVVRTAMRSAADIEDVGCPEPAAVLERMESTRSCCPSWRANSRSVVASASVVTVISLPTTCEWHLPRRNFAGPGVYSTLSLSVCRNRVEKQPVRPAGGDR